MDVELSDSKICERNDLAVADSSYGIFLLASKSSQDDGSFNRGRQPTVYRNLNLLHVHVAVGFLLY